MASTLDAYKTTLKSLIQNLASLPLSLRTFLCSSRSHHPSQWNFLCIRHGNISTAVELLPFGARLFWTQMGRLRKPLDKVIEVAKKAKRWRKDSND
jgi:hypothetical protein